MLHLAKTSELTGSSAAEESQVKLSCDLESLVTSSAEILVRARTLVGDSHKALKSLANANDQLRKALELLQTNHTLETDAGQTLGSVISQMFGGRGEVKGRVHGEFFSSIVYDLSSRQRNVLSTDSYFETRDLIERGVIARINSEGRIHKLSNLGLIEHHGGGRLWYLTETGVILAKKILEGSVK